MTNFTKKKKRKKQTLFPHIWNIYLHFLEKGFFFNFIAFLQFQYLPVQNVNIQTNLGCKPIKWVSDSFTKL